jgi:hypothetical protein
VHDAAPGRHPLQRARPHEPTVAEAVGVLDRARDHVGHRLESAVRVPREAGDEVLDVGAVHLVE